MVMPGVWRDDLCAQAAMPFVRAYLAHAAKHLNQQFFIKRTIVIMSTAELAGVTLNRLDDKYVLSRVVVQADEEDTPD